MVVLCGLGLILLVAYVPYWFFRFLFSACADVVEKRRLAYEKRWLELYQLHPPTIQSEEYRMRRALGLRMPRNK